VNISPEMPINDLKTRNFVQSISFRCAPDALRDEMTFPQHRAQPHITRSKEALSPVHDATFDVRSFYCYADGKMVSYAGVVCKTIQHDGQPFDIAGLSCVATDRNYQVQRGMAEPGTGKAEEPKSKRERTDRPRALGGGAH
jgi:hypothetical protein